MNAISDLAQKFGPMPALPLEIVTGSMSILRIGPVTVPLHGMVRIAMRSDGDMLLVLRRPRLEIQALPGVNMKIEIEDIWIGEDRPNFPFSSNQDWLGVIRPGEKLQAVLVNHMSQVANASVVVEGDAARVVHWGVDCSCKHGGGCPSCRWRTECRHEACERSFETSQRCSASRENAYLQTLSTSTPNAGTSNSTSMWRPWNPFR